MSAILTTVLRPLHRRREEYEFLPAIEETIERPVSPTARATTAVLLVLLGGAVAWASLAEIDMVAVAPGRIVPVGRIKVVQPLETARIHAIRVDDGDRVKAGDVLVELDPTETQADVAQLTYDRGRAWLDAEGARLVLADRPDEAIVAAAEGIDPDLAEATRLQAAAERAKLAATIEGLEADIAEKTAAIGATELSRKKATEILPLIETRREIVDGLWQKGLGMRQQVLDADQQIIERRAEIRATEETIVGLKAAIRSLSTRIDQARAATRADAMDRRAKALTRHADLGEELTKARRKAAGRSLIAPIDGVVQGVKIHTAGAVVTAADVLMSVVPEEAGLEAEVEVDNKDIGFVREAAPVEIKVEAFPFTRFGLVAGHVRRLGRDALVRAPQGPREPSADPSAAEVAGLIYPARIELATTALRVDGRDERLRPGMRVTAEIATGKRTVLEYLPSPVAKALKEAGRER